MKTSVRFIALVIAITATFVTQTAHAAQTLVITENSSTSLTAMLTSPILTGFLHVTNVGVDLWLVPLGETNGGVQAWIEPGAAGVFNTVQTFNGGQEITIFSDTGSAFGLAGLVDGTQDKTTFTYFGAPLLVTFNDNADAAEARVPDTGSTFGLLALALAALVGVSRLRSIRLA